MTHRIVIAVSATRPLRWHLRLRDRLAQLFPQSDVALAAVSGGADWPEGVGALLTLERLLQRRSQPPLSDKAAPVFSPNALEAADATVIDLAGGVAPLSGQRVLRVLYDGEAHDAFAIDALLGGRAPLLSVQAAGEGLCLAQGLPSLEAADGLTGGLDAVYSRLAALIERALVSPLEVVTPIIATPRTTARTPAVFALRNIGFRCARAIYHLCCYSPHWRVGWRFVEGPGALECGELSGAGWRVMQDRQLSFAADPFPIDWRGHRGVFFERLDYRTDKGAIFYQPFDDNSPVGEPTPVLEEAWHLSYPFLLTQGDALYMLPEASTSGAVTLYRCVDFPGRWEPVARLLEGVEAADATLFRHEGRFWMTSVVRDGVGGYSDMLALHYADDLFGPWREHAQRPVLIDARYARPAGAVVAQGGELLRPAQDCDAGYGKAVYVMRIDTLTPERFSQTPLRRIAPGGVWPGARLHTLNRSGRLEVIDGAVFTPKNVTLRKLVHGAIDRRRVRATPTFDADISGAMPRGAEPAGR